MMVNSILVIGWNFDGHIWFATKYIGMKYQVLFSQKGITFPSGCGRYDILYEKKFKCALAYAVAHDSWSLMSEGLWMNWANI